MTFTTQPPTVPIAEIRKLVELGGPEVQQQLVDLWLSRETNDIHLILRAYKIGLDEGLRRMISEVEKAWQEGCMAGNEAKHINDIPKSWLNSHARKVVEGEA
jgi:hypothetical protein